MRTAPTQLLAAAALVMAAITSVYAQTPKPPPLAPKLHDPGHTESAVNWCAFHIGRREFAEALADCDHAVAREPGNSRAHSNRGALHLHVGDFQQALVDFEHALRLTPDDALLYFNRGLARARLGRGKDAIADYTVAIQLKPDLAIAYHNRGYEYEVLGQRAHHPSVSPDRPERRHPADGLQAGLNAAQAALEEGRQAASHLFRTRALRFFSTGRAAFWDAHMPVETAQ